MTTDDRIALQTNRIATEWGATCAVFGREREVQCWGSNAQFCRPKSCAPQEAELPPCRLVPDRFLSRNCAVRPLPRPIRGAVSLARMGAVIAAGKADGRVFVIEPSEDGRTETEREYAPGLGATQRSGYFLRADGRIFERTGYSAVVPDDAPKEQRIVHIDMRFTELIPSYWNDSACGLTTDQGVYCWGNNVDGLLGLGDDVPLEVCGFLLEYSPSTAEHVPATAAPERGQCTDTPHRVPLPGPVRHLAGNQRRTRCATLMDGSVWWWGEMADGKLARTPRQVAGIHDAVASTCGMGFGCALREGGEVACWGRNDVGQLGIGTTEPSEAAVSVPGLSAVAELSAGQSHVCAVTVDRALYCFGSNGFGELGDGTFEDRSAPVQVQPPGTIAEPWHWSTADAVERRSVSK